MSDIPDPRNDRSVAGSDAAGRRFLRWTRGLRWFNRIVIGIPAGCGIAIALLLIVDVITARGDLGDFKGVLIESSILAVPSLLLLWLGMKILAALEAGLLILSGIAPRAAGFRAAYGAIRRAKSSA